MSLLNQSNNLINDSEKWDRGCQLDKVRNEFIIPSLLSHLQLWRPKKILDIGTGTAYVARAIDSGLSYKPQWVVIDKSADRISYTLENKLPNMNISAIVSTYDEFKERGGKYNAIMLLFTLLEMELNDKVCEGLMASLETNGLTYIAMPNSFEDVFNASLEDHSVLLQYLNNNCYLNKVDKFTEEAYPFKAHRFEYIIQCMLGSGNDLIHMQHTKIDNKETYLLVFKKNV